MFYYIDTIEQTKKKDEQGQIIVGAINEYGNREICKTKDSEGNIIPMPLDQVFSKFYKKLSDVSADLVSIDESKNHYYMDIKIVNSKGGIEKKDVIGSYVGE